MKAVLINRVSISGNSFEIRQSGYQGELYVDGVRICSNFTNESLVMGFIDKFTTQYPFVKVEKNTSRALARMAK